MDTAEWSETAEVAIQQETLGYMMLGLLGSCLAQSCLLWVAHAARSKARHCGCPPPCHGEGNRSTRHLSVGCRSKRPALLPARRGVAVQEQVGAEVLLVITDASDLRPSPLRFLPSPDWTEQLFNSIRGLTPRLCGGDQPSVAAGCSPLLSFFISSMAR